MDDATLLQRAEELFDVERLLCAATLLNQVKDVSLFTERHLMILRWADAVRGGMADLKQNPDEDGSPWKKQSETHGHRDFFVFYRITEDNQLISRIDCAIESSLLVPILSVFNESDLYSTWMPTWKKPIKLGISQTKKLKETGRGNQIIQVTVSLAWPFDDRELVMHVVAVDAIDEDGCIAIHAKSETPEDDPVIPEPLGGIVRMDYACSFLIQACPPDHPCLEKSKHRYPKDEELVLFSLKMTADPHVRAVPLSLQNFVTRTVIGRFWSTLLQVAEEVREGKRPVHKEAIDGKQELYAWIDQRISVLFGKLREQRLKEEEASYDVERIGA